MSSPPAVHQWDGWHGLCIRPCVTSLCRRRQQFTNETADMDSVLDLVSLRCVVAATDLFCSCLFPLFYYVTVLSMFSMFTMSVFLPLLRGIAQSSSSCDLKWWGNLKGKFGTKQDSATVIEFHSQWLGGATNWLQSKLRRVKQWCLQTSLFSARHLVGFVHVFMTAYHITMTSQRCSVVQCMCNTVLTVNWSRWELCWHIATADEF